MNKDKLTTIIGAIGAIATAATPVVNSMQNSSLHSGDYLQLAVAASFGLLGFFSNKK